MKLRSLFCAISVLSGIACAPRGFAAEANLTLLLWPNGVPGESNNVSEEYDTTKPSDNLIAGKSVIRLTNVSKPTIRVYRPPSDKANGAAVVICPGGGYSILAMDLEGTEVCEWLNSIGVTGVLLKYRVPARPGSPSYTAPLQDAQRAMGLVRSHATEWNIDPRRVGILGFSAGGNLSAVLSANAMRREYPLVDDADRESCRPDFQLLVYPAWLSDFKEGVKLVSQVAVSSNTPPSFLVMAEDDPIRVENALFYSLALKQFHVPCELHVYATGGHGYGLRRTSQSVTAWPDRAADWMRSLGILDRR